MSNKKQGDDQKPQPQPQHDPRPASDKTGDQIRKESGNQVTDWMKPPKDDPEKE